MVQNKGFIYKKVPEGVPVKGEHITVETREFDLEQEPPEGGITAKNYYASFDPYQRGRMRDPSTTVSYVSAFEPNKPLLNRTIKKVIKSANPKFAPGDVIITDYAPIEEYSVLPKELVDKSWKLENPYGLDPRHFVGALGMPGLTAFSSFYEIGKPKKGETIFISAASGAVGQIVGQLAKHEGLKVIGSVGNDTKLDFIIKELGFDGGFNYKNEKPADALKRLAPDGIDIYYENVGGEHLEASLDALNDFGRIVACGMISEYSLKPSEKYPIRNLMKVVSKRLTIRGFIVSDPNMGALYAREHQEKLQKWLADGTFKAKITVTEGIDNAPDGFLGMLRGENFGKALLQIADLTRE